MRDTESAAGAGGDRLIRRGLSLRHLRLIAVLEETGQVRAAAAQLNIAQPAASRLLAQLEEIVGVPLCIRHPRGVTLTEQGQRLADRAHGTLRALDAADREIAEAGAGRRGSVRIGAVTGPALEIVLPVLRQMRVTHPNIDVSIMVETSDRLAEALLAGRLDFYLGRIMGDADPGQFSARMIGEEELTLIVRAGHPLMRTPPQSLHDCLVYDWVMQTRDGLLNRTVEDFLVTHGYPQPARVTRTSSVMMTLAIISQSNAIAPVARSVAAFHGGPHGIGARFEELRIPERLSVQPYSLVRLAGQSLSPSSQAFCDAVMLRLDRMGEG